MKKKVLFVGESCVVYSTEFKGHNHFAGVQYSEKNGLAMKARLEKLGYEVEHMPCHRVAFDFPRTKEELAKYDVLAFSDVGADTFLLLPDMMKTGVRVPNLLSLIKEFVQNGGGFIMIGGYMTFAGIDGKGKYSGSHLEKVLPVNVLPYDDRTEIPEGADLQCVPNSHPILSGLPEKWPYILGYNKTIAKKDANVIVEFNGDPIIATYTYGKGRTVAYTTDCAAHWGPEAMTSWEYYDKLWNNIVAWACNEI